MDESIVRHYEDGVEIDRLAAGMSRIEFARTKELLERFLPPPPAEVLDVGGGPGTYAAWLAEAGYRVHLVDAAPLHVARARAHGGFTVALGDARGLEEPDSSYDAVLLLGPLYHLTERRDRVRALAEASRVVRPGGLVVAAAISRLASLLDGLKHGQLADAEFRAIAERDLAEGQHRNPRDRPGWFTTAFFHRPEELESELEDAGLGLEALLGIEGPGWLFHELWDDPQGRENILFAARAGECDPALVPLSAHLLAVASSPAG